MTFKPGDIAWNYYAGKDSPEYGKIKVKIIEAYNDHAVHYEVLEDFYDITRNLIYQAGEKDMIAEEHLELIESALASGQRIRGTVEGVYHNSIMPYIQTDNNQCVYLSDMTDVTVIKTLPTAPGSVVEFAGSLYSLTVSNVNGRPWQKVSSPGVYYGPKAFGDTWTLKFDAGQQ